MTPEVLAALLRDLVPAAIADLGGDVAAAVGEVRVERPRQRAHGDYATNVALQTAKRAGVPPRALAEALAAELLRHPGITAATVAGAGFVNVSVAASAQAVVAADIVAAGHDYGRAAPVARRPKINLEFVSANPTGPVHIGAVRWAAVGDALGRILEAAGAAVTREYYFNDAGAQIDRFARSLLAAARGEPVPEDGYAGSYVGDIAAQVVARNPGAADLPDEQAVAVFRSAGVDLMFDEIRTSLHGFGVDFDVYFNEKTLHEQGSLDLAVTELTRQGHIYIADGATWLRTTDFGDDKDRPLLKSDGDWTYFAADCAYYLDKRRRGFDRCVYMLGADHHGYVGRLQAMASCFGDDPDETIEVLIGQMVNLVRGGDPVRMSKRAGNVILLADLVEAIGADAARYALARYSADSPIDLDLDLWASRTEDNPVYYVQYAHARLSSLLRNAAEMGLVGGGSDDLAWPQPLLTGFRPELLDHPREGELLRALAGYPGVVTTAAELREPHRIARYLEGLAGQFHRFYDVCRVLPLGEEPLSDVHRARLVLVSATRVVFANGLGLLGVTAPERM